MLSQIRTPARVCDPKSGPAQAPQPRLSPPQPELRAPQPWLSTSSALETEMDFGELEFRVREHYKMREEGKLNLARCKRSHEYLAVYSQAPHPRKLEDIVQQPLREWLRDLAMKLGLSGAETNSMVDDPKLRHPESGTGSPRHMEILRNNFIWTNPITSFELVDESEW
ncbi:hypothetical protein DL768_001104 [Monosporascus sp. mg162]|nr:hypothetical protein DL768_001104 [Monosporascus sp. mg162]